MRTSFSILLFCLSLALSASEFTIFEKDGYFGIKDDSGNITVPAVYEKLGWSSGESKVVNGVIGFKEKNLWGLITVRNKSLTGQKFYSIRPLHSGYFIASIKGNFSNRLFHGILDTKGKTVVSFNYFSIESLGTNWLVSDFDGKRQLFGIVSFDNRILIPPKYLSIKQKNELIIAGQANLKLSLFSKVGSLLQSGLDSIRYVDGWITYRDGYAGFLSTDGGEIHPIDYKSIKVGIDHISPDPFPEWTIYKNDSVFMKWRCDSLALGENGMLTAYLNGAHHFIINSATLLEHHELILKEVTGSKLIVQNSKTGTWSVLTNDGSALLSEYDSIHTDGSYFITRKKGSYKIFDENGKLSERLAYQMIKRGINGQSIARRNGYWGILSSRMKSQTPCKYDSILKSENFYKVSYLNQWGTMNELGEWIIRPQFNEIYTLGTLTVGRRGLGYSIFLEGEKVQITTNKPIRSINSATLILGEDMKYGLLNKYGELLLYPQYDTIKAIGEFFGLKRGDEISLVSSTGEEIIRAEESYQSIHDYREDYFLVKKENRWGFTDNQGRLRISNRYDSARIYQEGYAAVQLRGRWGFIDKSENLVVQPYYHSVSDFRNGKSIVFVDGKYGLIDKKGKEVLRISFKDISKFDTGNYRVENANGRVGLVNSDGSIILRPAYDELLDLGSRVLVSNRGVWGILNYSGEQIFKINHKDIKVSGEYTMIKD